MVSHRIADHGNPTDPLCGFPEFASENSAIFPEMFFSKSLIRVGRSSFASASASDVVPGLQWHAFVWSPATGIVDLGTLGGTEAAAMAVNDIGEIAGYSKLPGTENTHAFRHAGGAMSALGW
jgi:probable HAF family extracellular repeat protein